MSFVEVDNLGIFLDKQEILRNLSFSLDEFGATGLLGANGAGKTTLLRILTTYLLPTTGKVSIAGYQLDRDKEQIKRLVAYVPERAPLYPDLTVREYLRFIRELVCKGPSIEDQVINYCELEGVVNLPCHALSSGFKKRVAFAQALIREPKLLLLDEPTNGLDLKQITSLRRLISRLAKEMKIIISSHVIKEIECCCERVLILSEGQVVVDNEIAHITADKTLEESVLLAIANTSHKH